METKNYQFTQVPTNLFILLDNNCRSMLFTLIQLSSYYADEKGWFFRTWEDLVIESNLSINLSMATVQTLFNHHIIEAKPTGYGKGKKPNYYKVNFDNFAKYDEISIEDAMKNPDLKIRTVDYKGSNFKLNLVRETVNNVVTNVVKSENNIYNINNKENKENIKNIENENKRVEVKKTFPKCEIEQSKSSTVEDVDCDWNTELSRMKAKVQRASTFEEIKEISNHFKKLADTNPFPIELEEELHDIKKLSESKVWFLKAKTCYTN